MALQAVRQVSSINTTIRNRTLVYAEFRTPNSALSRVIIHSVTIVIILFDVLAPGGPKFNGALAKK